MSHSKRLRFIWNSNLTGSSVFLFTKCGNLVLRGQGLLSAQKVTVQEPVDLAEEVLHIWLQEMKSFNHCREAVLIAFGYKRKDEFLPILKCHISKHFIMQVHQHTLKCDACSAATPRLPLQVIHGSSSSLISWNTTDICQSPWHQNLYSRHCLSSFI